jgi:3-oxoacyl-[acyl-carrier-protein] synthase-3
MRWERVCVEAIAYELPDERIGSAELEGRLQSLYQRLRIPDGQLMTMTGIRERRWWPEGPCLADHAARAGRRALEEAGVAPEDIGTVIYGGVCRDDMEPATACRVADTLGVRGDALVLDLSNACLGVLNGMVAVANRIELGQIRAGLVVSCETAREIGEDAIARMLADPSVATWSKSIASLTGGSGAIAVVLTDRDFSFVGRRLVGAAVRAAPEHHRIARWGARDGIAGQTGWIMDTDAAQILTHGIELGKRTWAAFLKEVRWQPEDVDRVVMHQVGAVHQSTILSALGIDPDREFSTFETLGNIGTVSLPITVAKAAEDGFIVEGDRVGLLGIGTGLNCLMLGIQW